MKHFRFSSIEQFRHTVKVVRDTAKYHNIPLPTLKFIGSVKLHGTNASVVKDLRTGEMWAQSRESIITPEKDNAGFAAFVEQNKHDFDNLLSNIPVDSDEPATHVAIYGEWCGKSIQKGVAISQLDRKIFVIFGAKFILDSENDEDPITSWLTPNDIKPLIVTHRQSMLNLVNRVSLDIFTIYEFPTWEIDIDFARPEQSQAELVRLTNEVEAECPVGKAFGFSGIGEGIVWECLPANFPNCQDLVFKVKGEKHSVTKVKTLAEVDVEKVANARAFADAVVTEARLEQMYGNLVESGVELDVKNTGQFLKLVSADVIKEETDRLKASGLEWKDAARCVSEAARQWWMEKVTV